MEQQRSLPNGAPPLAGWKAWFFRHIPAFDSLRGYSWAALTGDLTAGLTVATVAVPQAMAYATLAGVPPQYGLFTAIVMTGVGALLDSSRQLINGPTNAISIAMLSALAVFPEGEQRMGPAVVLAFMVGIVQIVIALARLGDLTRYVSHSVIVGFTLGAGSLIILDQMKNFLGLAAGGASGDHFLKRFWLSLTTGGPVHWPTVLIGVGTIVIVLGLREFNAFCRKRGSRFPIPQHFVAVVVMAALVWGFQLDARHGVRIVGSIPSTLPNFQVPDFTWEQVRQMGSNAFAIALLGLLEAIAMAKAIASRTGQALDINQQCLSEGAANLAGSFFQCMPGSGSLTRSAVNQQAGAVTQWSGVVSAAAVAAMVVLFAPFARYIPRASLAGILVLAAFRMMDREQLAFHLRATRLDAGVVLMTALAAVAISVEFCIVIGVFLSFVLYVPRAAQVRMTSFVRTPDNGVRERRPGDTTCDRLLIYQLEGELFFGSEPEVKKHLAVVEQAARDNVRAVILLLERARNPDAAFLTLLRTLDSNLRQREVALLLCGVAPDLSKALMRTGLDDQLGKGRIFAAGTGHEASCRAAILSAYQLLGDTLCATCPRRQEGYNGHPPMDYLDYLI